MAAYEISGKPITVSEFALAAMSQTKFSDFKSYGKQMWLVCDESESESAYLMLDSEMEIKVSPKPGLGGILLARVIKGKLEIVSWLSHPMRENLYDSWQLEAINALRAANS